MRGLRELYPATKPDVDFTAHVLDIEKKLVDKDLAADLIDQYIEGRVHGKNLAHFIDASLALTLQATREHDSGRFEAAWFKLCHAFFVGGMANLQLNLTRGPQMRTQAFQGLRLSILQIIERRCPPEKWASLPEMWRAIQEPVIAANDLLLNNPGFSKDPEGLFVLLAKEQRATFELYLSSPVKRGRPKKRPPQ